MDDDTLSALALENAVQRYVASSGRWTQSGPKVLRNSHFRVDMIIQQILR
jgi:hypothetical protein